MLQPVLDNCPPRRRKSRRWRSSTATTSCSSPAPARRGYSPAGLDIGYRLPAFCTSVGRGCSRLADDELAAALGDGREPQTPFTVTDRKKLLETIVADRAQGYSLVDREAEPGFRSISVPVRRYDGTIVAAINMGAHVDRVSSEEMIERFLPRLQETAASVKSLLV